MVVRVGNIEPDSAAFYIPFFTATYKFNQLKILENVCASVQKLCVRHS